MSDILSEAKPSAIKPETEVLSAPKGLDVPSDAKPLNYPRPHLAILTRPPGTKDKFGEPDESSDVFPYIGDIVGHDISDEAAGNSLMHMKENKQPVPFRALGKKLIPNSESHFDPIKQNGKMINPIGLVNEHPFDVNDYRFSKENPDVFGVYRDDLNKDEPPVKPFYTAISEGKPSNETAISSSNEQGQRNMAARSPLARINLALLGGGAALGVGGGILLHYLTNKNKKKEQTKMAYTLPRNDVNGNFSGILKNLPKPPNRFGHFKHSFAHFLRNSNPGIRMYKNADFPGLNQAVKQISGPKPQAPGFKPNLPTGYSPSPRVQPFQPGIPGGYKPSFPGSPMTPYQPPQISAPTPSATRPISNPFGEAKPITPSSRPNGQAAPAVDVANAGEGKPAMPGDRPNGQAAPALSVPNAGEGKPSGYEALNPGGGGGYNGFNPDTIKSAPANINPAQVARPTQPIPIGKANMEGMGQYSSAPLPQTPSQQRDLIPTPSGRPRRFQPAPVQATPLSEINSRYRREAQQGIQSKMQQGPPPRRFPRPPVRAIPLQELQERYRREKMQQQQSPGLNKAGGFFNGILSGATAANKGMSAMPAHALQVPRRANIQTPQTVNAKPVMNPQPAYPEREKDERFNNVVKAKPLPDEHPTDAGEDKSNITFSPAERYEHLNYVKGTPQEHLLRLKQTVRHPPGAEGASESKPVPTGYLKGGPAKPEPTTQSPVNPQIKAGQFNLLEPNPQTVVSLMHPLSGALRGAGIGGLIGAARSKHDLRSDILRGALQGGVVGTGAGAGSAAGYLLANSANVPSDTVQGVLGRLALQGGLGTLAGMGTYFGTRPFFKEKAHHQHHHTKKSNAEMGYDQGLRPEMSNPMGNVPANAGPGPSTGTTGAYPMGKMPSVNLRPSATGENKHKINITGTTYGPAATGVSKKIASIRDVSPFCASFLDHFIAQGFSQSELSRMIVKSASKDPQIKAEWDKVFEVMEKIGGPLSAAAEAGEHIAAGRANKRLRGGLKAIIEDLRNGNVGRIPTEPQVIESTAGRSYLIEHANGKLQATQLGEGGKPISGPKEIVEHKLPNGDVQLRIGGDIVHEAPAGGAAGAAGVDTPLPAQTPLPDAATAGATPEPSAAGPTYNPEDLRRTFLNQNKPGWLGRAWQTLYPPITKPLPVPEPGELNKADFIRPRSKLPGLGRRALGAANLHNTSAGLISASAGYGLYDAWKRNQPKTQVDERVPLVPGSQAEFMQNPEIDAILRAKDSSSMLNALQTYDQKNGGILGKLLIQEGKSTQVPGGQVVPDYLSLLQETKPFEGSKGYQSLLGKLSELHQAVSGVKRNVLATNGELTPENVNNYFTKLTGGHIPPRAGAIPSKPGTPAEPSGGTTATPNVGGLFNDPGKVWEGLNSNHKLMAGLGGGAALAGLLGTAMHRGEGPNMWGPLLGVGGGLALAHGITGGDMGKLLDKKFWTGEQAPETPAAPAMPPAEGLKMPAAPPIPAAPNSGTSFTPEANATNLVPGAIKTSRYRFNFIKKAEPGILTMPGADQMLTPPEALSMPQEQPQSPSLFGGISNVMGQVGQGLKNAPKAIGQGVANTPTSVPSALSQGMNFLNKLNPNYKNGPSAGPINYPQPGVNVPPMPDAEGKLPTAQPSKPLPMNQISVGQTPNLPKQMNTGSVGATTPQMPDASGNAAAPQIRVDQGAALQVAQHYGMPLNTMVSQLGTPNSQVNRQAFEQIAEKTGVKEPGMLQKMWGWFNGLDPMHKMMLVGGLVLGIGGLVSSLSGSGGEGGGGLNWWGPLLGIGGGLAAAAGAGMFPSFDKLIGSQPQGQNAPQGQGATPQISPLAPQKPTYGLKEYQQATAQGAKTEDINGIPHLANVQQMANMTPEAKQAFRAQMVKERGEAGGKMVDAWDAEANHLGMERKFGQEQALVNQAGQAAKKLDKGQLQALFTQHAPYMSPPALTKASLSVLQNLPSSSMIPFMDPPQTKMLEQMNGLVQATTNPQAMQQFIQNTAKDTGAQLNPEQVQHMAQGVKPALDIWAQANQIQDPNQRLAFMNQAFANLDKAHAAPINASLQALQKYYPDLNKIPMETQLPPMVGQLPPGAPASAVGGGIGTPLMQGNPQTVGQLGNVGVVGGSIGGPPANPNQPPATSVAGGNGANVGNTPGANIDWMNKEMPKLLVDPTLTPQKAAEITKGLSYDAKVTLAQYLNSNVYGGTKSEFASLPTTQQPLARRNGGILLSTLLEENSPEGHGLPLLKNPAFPQTLYGDARTYTQQLKPYLNEYLDELKHPKGVNELVEAIQQPDKYKGALPKLTGALAASSLIPGIKEPIPNNIALRAYLDRELEPFTSGKLSDPKTQNAIRLREWLRDNQPSALGFENGVYGYNGVMPPEAEAAINNLRRGYQGEGEKAKPFTYNHINDIFTNLQRKGYTPQMMPGSPQTLAAMDQLAKKNGKESLLDWIYNRKPEYIKSEFADALKRNPNAYKEMQATLGQQLDAKTKQIMDYYKNGEIPAEDMPALLKHLDWDRQARVALGLPFNPAVKQQMSLADLITEPRQVVDKELPFTHTPLTWHDEADIDRNKLRQFMLASMAGHAPGQFPHNVAGGSKAIWYERNAGRDKLLQAARELGVPQDSDSLKQLEQYLDKFKPVQTDISTPYSY